MEFGSLIFAWCIRRKIGNKSILFQHLKLFSWGMVYILYKQIRNQYNTWMKFVSRNYEKEVYWWFWGSFLDSHPKEIIVMELTRHGGDCENSQTEYPDVSHEIKYQWLQKILTILIYVPRQSPSNEQQNHEKSPSKSIKAFWLKYF